MGTSLHDIRPPIPTQAIVSLDVQGGYTTIEDLAGLRASELLKFKGLGRKTYYAIQKQLYERGLGPAVQPVGNIRAASKISIQISKIRAVRDRLFAVGLIKPMEELNGPIKELATIVFYLDTMHLDD